MTHPSRSGTRRVARGLVITTALAGLAARLFRRVVVEGDSMQPTLEPGDRLILMPVVRPRVGDLVGVIDPREPQRLIVKRVVATTYRGYTVLGDNRDASTDSRDFGPVPAGNLRGRAVYRYAPEHRRGRL